MTFNPHRILFLAVAAMAITLGSCGSKPHIAGSTESYTKRERNLLREGTHHFRDSDFRQAEIAYDKTLAENPNNSHAIYNSALTHLNRVTAAETPDKNAISGIDSLFESVYQTPGADTLLREHSRYNRGNLAFNAEDYTSAIEMYKSILRANPSNIEALENLRLAQIKLQEQQDQQQENQQQNQDDNNNQDKDDKQQQQNQEQNQQNQDQEQKDQDKNQNQQNQEQQDYDQEKQGQNKPRPQDQDRQSENKTGMSEANAKQILDAMEKKEAATRQRVEGMKADEERRAAARASTNKPW